MKQKCWCKSPCKSGKAKKRKKNGDLKAYGQGIRAETWGGKPEVLAVGNNCRKLFYINTLNNIFCEIDRNELCFQKGIWICGWDWEVEQETQFDLHGLYGFSVGIDQSWRNWQLSLKEALLSLSPWGLEERNGANGTCAPPHPHPHFCWTPRLLPVQWLTLSRVCRTLLFFLLLTVQAASG